MKLRIEPYTSAHAAAARGFNARIGSAAEFHLPPEPPVPEPEDAPIANRHFVVLEEDEVRGGFLLAGYRGVFGAGPPVRVWNYREPLSEGIVNPHYSLLAIRMLKHIQHFSPYVFALGMGGEQLPFPRLLRGAGWTVRPVPFLFRVFSGGRFARELRLFERQPVRTAARIAAATGMASLGAATLHARSLPLPLITRGYTIDREPEWGTWADDVWPGFREACSFSVVRDRESLSALYPLASGRIQAYTIRRAGTVAGWAAVMNTTMTDHKYFGNLKVGTILDCVSLSQHMRASIALATRQLAQDGADIVVTNQSHVEMVRAFRQNGFLSARSNYILALSKAFTAEISKQTGGQDRAHFTRGDSDGRIHL